MPDEDLKVCDVEVCEYHSTGKYTKTNCLKYFYDGEVCRLRKAWNARCEDCEYKKAFNGIDKILKEKS